MNSLKINDIIAIKRSNRPIKATYGLDDKWQRMIIYAYIGLFEFRMTFHHCVAAPSPVIISVLNQPVVQKTCITLSLPCATTQACNKLLPRQYIVSITVNPTVNLRQNPSDNCKLGKCVRFVPNDTASQVLYLCNWQNLFVAT